MAPCGGPHKLHVLSVILTNLHLENFIVKIYGDRCGIKSKNKKSSKTAHRKAKLTLFFVVANLLANRANSVQFANIEPWYPIIDRLLSQ